MDVYRMGADVQQSMKQGIADSSMAVILACPEYMDRPNCRTEWEAIVSCGKPFQVVNVHSSSPFAWCTDKKRTFYTQVLNPEQRLFVACRLSLVYPLVLAAAPVTTCIRHYRAPCTCPTC